MAKYRKTTIKKRSGNKKLTKEAVDSLEDSGGGEETPDIENQLSKTGTVSTDLKKSKDGFYQV